MEVLRIVVDALRCRLGRCARAVGLGGQRVEERRRGVGGTCGGLRWKVRSAAFSCALMRLVKSPSTVTE